MNALSQVTGNTTVFLADGTYNGNFSVNSKNPAPTTPIVVRAVNPGRAVLAGRSSLTVSKSSNLTIANLKFLSGASSVVRIDASHHVRLTGSTFDRGAQPATSPTKWVYISGQPSYFNRIDHNTFQNKTDPGNYLALDGKDGRISQYDRIDHNTFRAIGPRIENGKEAVRLGTSSFSLLSAYTTFEYNLFEACDGDPEWLSIKVSDVTVRYNTARASQGSLTLRHGNRNNVYGNVILGENKVGTGGIRMYGVDHEVFSNYIANTAGTSYESALSVDGGDAVPGGSPSAHHRVDNASVVYNTLVDNATGIVVGEHYKYAPTNLRLENNLLADSKTVVIIKAPIGGTIRTNTVGTKTAVGLAQVNGIWKLTATSNQINKGTGATTYRYWDGSRNVDAPYPDMDAQTRTGVFDIGADEYVAQ